MEAENYGMTSTSGSSGIGFPPEGVTTTVYLKRLLTWSLSVTVSESTCLLDLGILCPAWKGPLPDANLIESMTPSPERNQCARCLFLIEIGTGSGRTVRVSPFTLMQTGCSSSRSCERGGMRNLLTSASRQQRLCRRGAAGSGGRFEASRTRDRRGSRRFRSLARRLGRGSEGIGRGDRGWERRWRLPSGPAPYRGRAGRPGPRGEQPRPGGRRVHSIGRGAPWRRCRGG